MSGKQAYRAAQRRLIFLEHSEYQTRLLLNDYAMQLMEQYPLWPLLFRRLAGDLIQQDFVPHGDDSAALDTFQV